MFELTAPQRIVFGPGAFAEAAPAVAALGRRALIVTGRAVERAEPLVQKLKDAGVPATTYSVHGEPTVETVRAAAEAARAGGCDVVVGFGGGSALDAAKAAAALLGNGGDPFDYLEIVGRGRPLERPAAPMVAIPTTAGTGSEVTKNAVLFSPEHGVKASLRSPFLLPRVAVVDPDLTLGLSPEVTATTGLDALAQLVEPFTSQKRSPLVDALCVEGMRRSAHSLRRACEHGDDRHAREDLALASLFGGLALANAGLGAAHGFAAPLGGLFPAPHGAICARLLPFVMAVNVKALAERAPKD